MPKDKACLIQHCPNMARVRSPVCAACASSFRYWDKKGSGAILERQDRLEKWQDRMQYLGNRDKEYRNVARKIQNRRGG
jgi:hypothetical protein